MIVPIFLPNLGCKPRCIYCDQRYITETEEFNEESVFKSLENLKPGSELGIYGGDPLGLEEEELKRVFSLIDPFLDRISRIIISTRPRPLSFRIKDLISYLVSKKVKIFELGIPTFNERILEFLNRGHGVLELKDMYSYLRDLGLEVALQVMVGLPYEERKDIFDLVENLVSLRPSYVRIYPLAVIGGTPLERLLKEKSIVLSDFSEVLKRTSFIYASLKKAGIEVRKIGLTDNPSLKNRLVGGFYHPAFGYLVRSFLFYQAIKHLVERNGKRGKVRISVKRNEIPHVYGERGENIRSLKDLGIEVEVGTHDLDDNTIFLTGPLGERIDAISVLDAGLTVLDA